MILLPESEYIKMFLKAGGKKRWWGYPRGFVWDNEMYINKDAYFFNDKDYWYLVFHLKRHRDSKPHTLTTTEKILGEDHTWFGLMSPWNPLRYKTVIKEIQEKAKAVSEQTKNTPFSDLGNKINQIGQDISFVSQDLSFIRDPIALQKHVTSMESALSAICNKMPERERREVSNLLVQVENESLVEDKLPLITMVLSKISSQMDFININYTVIGGNLVAGDYVKGDKINIGDVQGDVIGVAAKITGNGIIGKNIGEIKLNQQQLANIPDEYAKSLQAFSEAVNAQLKKHNVSQEKAAPVQESINELAKEVEGIKPEEKIDTEKQEDIKYKIKKTALKLRKILPDVAETVATFTPLAPFSKIIGKGVEEIVKE